MVAWYYVSAGGTCPVEAAFQDYSDHSLFMHKGFHEEQHAHQANPHAVSLRDGIKITRFVLTNCTSTPGSTGPTIL